MDICSLASKIDSQHYYRPHQTYDPLMNDIIVGLSLYQATLTIAPRNTVKTSAACVFAIWRTLTIPHTTVVVMASNYYATQRMMDWLCIDLSVLGIEAKKNGDSLLLENGSIIRLVSRIEAIRGWRIDCFICDDFDLRNDQEDVLMGVYLAGRTNMDTHFIATSERETHILDKIKPHVMRYTWRSSVGLSQMIDSIKISVSPIEFARMYECE